VTCRRCHCRRTDLGEHVVNLGNYGWVHCDCSCHDDDDFDADELGLDPEEDYDARL